jgi:hypothetical protein
VVGLYLNPPDKALVLCCDEKSQGQALERTQPGLPLGVGHTPTSSSWLNLVERFFRDLTQAVVREGSFGSVRELMQAIKAYLTERNLAPKRYVWKKKGEEILAKITKARAMLTATQSL